MRIGQGIYGDENERLNYIKLIYNYVNASIRAHSSQLPCFLATVST
jgi:hypothetical protein